MNDVTDLVEIKLALSDIRGELATMRAEFKADDKDALSSVKLLAQALENQSKSMSEVRQDLKEAMAKFDERTEAYREHGRQQATAVRKDLERQITEHSTADAPHEKTLGSRLDALEKHQNRLVGAVTLVGFVGLSGVAALVKAFGG